MLRPLLFVFLITITLLPLRPAHAQELTFALGATDYGDVGDDSVFANVEYRFRPFRQREVMSLAWGATASVSGEGDIFVGGGLWTRWEWQSGWFIDLSTMPGLYDEGTDNNDLGSAFEIRSLLGFGYQFANGGALSLAASHISNAGLADDNPGVNGFLLRYHRRF